MGALDIWFDCSLPHRSPPSSLVQQPGGHRWKAWTVPRPRSNWEGKMTLVPRKWRDNQGKPGNPPQNSMGSYWFIFISFYFPFWWSRIVTSCGIILLTHSSPCCGNLTLKGRAVLYWTLIIVLGTNQHEINMNSTWNQHETNMKPIWNQHERSWHVINMQNIKWQKVASLRTHHWINLSQVPDSKISHRHLSPSQASLSPPSSPPNIAQHHVCQHLPGIRDIIWDHWEDGAKMWRSSTADILDTSKWSMIFSRTLFWGCLGLICNYNIL